MFTYLVLLNDPAQHALLCVEEPENQLYRELLDEIFYFEKKEGFTTIRKASDNSIAKVLYETGDLPGALWKHGLFTEGTL